MNLPKTSHRPRGIHPIEKSTLQTLAGRLPSPHDLFTAEFHTAYHEEGTVNTALYDTVHTATGAHMTSHTAGQGAHSRLAGSVQKFGVGRRRSTLPDTQSTVSETTRHATPRHATATHLQAVKQRLRDGVGFVGRGDEEHRRQVERQVQVVILRRQNGVG